MWKKTTIRVTITINAAPLPVRHRGNLESADLTMGVGVTAGAPLG